MQSGIHHEEHEGAHEEHEDEPGNDFVPFLNFVVFVIESKAGR